jgi:hypothetical protein
VSDRAAPEEYGRLAYDAYCAATGNRSAVTGEPLPDWKALADRESGVLVRQAWARAAFAVRARTLSEFAELVDRGPTFPLMPSIIADLAREHAQDSGDAGDPASQE